LISRTGFMYLQITLYIYIERHKLENMGVL